MVVAVTRLVALRHAVRLLALLLLAAPVMAHAMGAAAPFVPPKREPLPAAKVQAQAQANVADPAASAASSTAMSQATASALAGVRLGSRPQALIDGAWVDVGASARGARLAAVRADHAVLAHPDGRTERLELLAGVQLRSSAQVAAQLIEERQARREEKR